MDILKESVRKVATKRLKLTRDLFYYLIIIFILLSVLFPFFNMVSYALKTPLQIMAYPPLFIFKPTLQNFLNVLQRQALLAYIINSFIIALSSTLLGFLLGLPAAYSIARYRQSILALIILAARMVPFVSCLLPWYIIFQRLGLIDRYPALILTHLVLVLPFSVGIMIGFFEDIPIELEEAAWIDGCTKVGTFFRIVLPLVKPGVVATAILSFTQSWNNFLFALVLSGRRLKTAPVAVYSFMSFEEINWGGISAAATIITLPILVFTLIIQKHMVRGLVVGGLK